MAIAIVGGALANKPQNGGNAWSRLGFVLGLRPLGFDVVFVEQLPEATQEARAYFERVCQRFAVEGRLLTEPAPPRDVLEQAEAASVLVNIGGHLTDPELIRAPGRRIFVDDDPVYTQAWHAQGLLGERLAGHDAYFSVGLNVGSTGSNTVGNGIEWHPTLPPVPLDYWTPANGGQPRRFTTVASWRGAYGPLEHEGRSYGQKAHEFRKVVELPTQVAGNFELALDIHPADKADVELLELNGWLIVDPRDVAGTPEGFHDYVQHSSAEFSVAQGAYVETQSGWFSDRTAKYLASGRPALVQDTGFGHALPVGEGLVSFATLEEAVAGVQRISNDYEAHRQAARALAEEHLDAERVLARMLDQAGVT